MNESTQGLVERERTADLEHEVDRLYRHAVAAFHQPCTCKHHWCLRCFVQRIPWPRRAVAGNWMISRLGQSECPKHDNTCAACIAEHAALCANDHPLVHPSAVR